MGQVYLPTFGNFLEDYEIQCEKIFLKYLEMFSRLFEIPGSYVTKVC